MKGHAMRRKLIALMIIVLQLAVVGPALSQEGVADPALVKQYMELIPSPKKMISDMVRQKFSQKGSNLPASQIDQFLSFVDFNRIDRALAETVAHRYTNNELVSFNKFLSSPEGKSYLSKQQQVAQDMTKVLVQEIMEAGKKFQESIINQQKGKGK